MVPHLVLDIYVNFINNIQTKSIKYSYIFTGEKKKTDNLSCEKIFSTRINKF